MNVIRSFTSNIGLFKIYSTLTATFLSIELQVSFSTTVVPDSQDSVSEHQSQESSDAASQSDTWEPDESSSVSTESGDEEERQVHFERKYFVFESCLMQLFAICTTCLGPCIDISTTMIGSMITIKAMCSAGHVRSWKSQPMLGDMPMGNFTIAASTLLSGCQPGKIFLFQYNLQSPCFVERTYHLIQKLYLIPSILEHWRSVQYQLLSGGQKIKAFGGDARMDSPGHTAKYGSYSLMGLDRNKIISVNTLQVRLCFKYFHRVGRNETLFVGKVGLHASFLIHLVPSLALKILLQISHACLQKYFAESAMPFWSTTRMT